MNLFLTGFMGSGKSSVGKLLAQKLRWPFLDTDACIEAESGRRIAQIFAEEGEKAFRSMELEICQRLPANHVVALGGGTYIQEAHREVLASKGLTIFLEWPIDILLARVLGDEARPLAKDPQAFRQLYQQRLPMYRLAEITWKSQAPYRETVAEVVAILLQQLRQRGGFLAGDQQESSKKIQ